MSPHGKLPVRDRVAALVDPDSFFEDGRGTDGVVTGVGTLGGRTVALMGDDSIADAGDSSARAVEKILRIQERARALSQAIPSDENTPFDMRSADAPWA